MRYAKENESEKVKSSRILILLFLFFEIKRTKNFKKYLKNESKN